MMTADAIPAQADAVAEAKAYLRVDGTDDDALLGRLVVAAIGHGEGFTGSVLIARTVREIVPVSCAWRRLGATPVSAITVAQGLAIGVDPVALAIGSYAIDIDAAGDGWLRVTAAGAATRVAVTYTAGLAATWAALPEPLRQGVIRLASHLYSHRDAADEGAPPAAVAALWRPFRRMRLS